MTPSHAAAVATLYQAPLQQFVAERKRLVAALKASGDKTGAAELASSARPPLSAWAVNQLWWRARNDFEGLFESAAQVRHGHPSALGRHREALARLRAQAAGYLTEAGHGAADATLRRVGMTLSALAAAGAFDPDPPGALAADREPPGFEVFGIGVDDADSPAVEPARVTTPAPRARAKEPPAPSAASAREKRSTNAVPASDTSAAERREAATKAREQAEAQRRQAAETAREQAEARRRAAADQAREQAEAAERRRQEEQTRSRRRAEQQRLKAELEAAEAELAACERTAERLRLELRAAERALEQARLVSEARRAELNALETSE